MSILFSTLQVYHQMILERSLLYRFLIQSAQQNRQHQQHTMITETKIATPLPPGDEPTKTTGELHQEDDSTTNLTNPLLTPSSSKHKFQLIRNSVANNEMSIIEYHRAQDIIAKGMFVFSEEPLHTCTVKHLRN